ncbi:MAG: ATP phosphoribosyltransferase [Bacteroidales bacterium]
MTKLRIAIQKSGRLSEKSLQLLNDCGISISNGNRTLLAAGKNFPVEILYLRDDDIPGYIEDEVADVGILGENVVLEKSQGLQIVSRLGFARCRMSLAIPRGEEYTGPQYLQGKRIATSYPRILKNFLQQNQVDADIHEILGSVEIAPSIGLSGAIFDIVSTGSTLLSNGLKEVDVVLKSEAVMVSRPQLDPEKQAILDKLLFRVNAVLKARNNRYVLLNAPNESLEKIISIIPGMKSPTVVPLAEEGWSAVHSVISEDRFWEVIDQLKDVGAQGLLVIPIEKMVN